jgi:hypothetical protein
MTFLPFTKRGAAFVDSTTLQAAGSKERMSTVLQGGEWLATDSFPHSQEKKIQ